MAKFTFYQQIFTLIDGIQRIF